MLSKKFYITFIIRLVLIFLTCLVLSYIFLKEERLFSIIGLSLLLIIQLSFLFKYSNQFNKEIANFFSALKNNDASYAFHDKLFPHISEEMRNDINYIKNQLFSITEQKKIQEHYFKNIIENAQTGIIAIDENGKTDVINKSALEILDIDFITHFNSIKEIHPAFYQLVIKDKAGTQKMVLIKGKSKAIPLAVRISEFKQKERKYKLVSFQNINSELEHKETESWQKLIRVLTHEINNTVSPVTSLANTLKKAYTGKENTVISKNEITDKTLQKTQEGLHIISQRGEGLIDFVNKYRSVASLKKLNPEPFKVAELFYNLELLMKPILDEKNIKLDIKILPFDMELNADKKYLEQIFINLIKNATEAIEHKEGKIKLEAFIQEKNVLQIKDNGNGISPEIADKIFIPFFTTKNNGSGIGLSLARQVMQLHGGSISVISEEGRYTLFKLTF